MKLLVDVGNSRIKWKYGETAAVADSLEQLDAQWQGLDKRGIQRAIGGCVRGKALARQIDELALTRFKIRVDWQAAEPEACGVTNAYANPQDLGIDRWAALIAAHARYTDQPCIVVDAGTAITVDMLEASGMHRGGVILPGAGSLFDTLTRAEQLFPDSSQNLHALANTVQPLTNNTRDALLAGIIFMVQGGVKTVIEQQAEQIKAKIEVLPILITGGDSIMLKLDSLQTVQVPDLVLEGLSLLAESRK